MESVRRGHCQISSGPISAETVGRPEIVVSDEPMRALMVAYDAWVMYVAGMRMSDASPGLYMVMSSSFPPCSSLGLPPTMTARAPRLIAARALSAKGHSPRSTRAIQFSSSSGRWGGRMQSGGQPKLSGARVAFALEIAIGDGHACVNEESGRT